MLSIGEITGASYLLDGGSGCGACAHAVLPSAYAMDAVTAGDPPGVWAVRGENTLRLEGTIAPKTEAADAYRLIFDKLEDPTRKRWVEDPETGEGEWVGEKLGQPLAQYKSVEQKVAAWRRKHPDATPEQVNSFRVTAQRKQRQAITGWDLTFSPHKSWSVVHAALQKAGRYDEAALAIQAQEAGVKAALDYAFEHGIIQTRKGAQGPKVGGAGGRTTTEYLQAKNAIIAIFMHHVSRERDPQIHWHASLANRVQGEDGTWRAIYSPGLLKNKHLLNAVYEAVSEAEAERLLGWEFVSRPDGIGREVAGVDLETIEFYSSRVRKMSWRAEELVDAYRARYGVEPDARRKWQMLQHANKATRRAKVANPPSREEELDRFEADLRARTQGSLYDVLDDVDAHRSMEPVVQREEPVELDRRRVVLQALADLGTKKGTASESQLAHAIHVRLPDDLGLTAAARQRLILELVEEAQASGECVSTRAKPVAEAPPSLRNPVTGRSRFEAPLPRRFTTRTHLAKESGLVARLDKPSEVAVTREQVATALAGRKLGRDQAAAVEGVLGSGRFIDAMEAPAGSGKSYTLKATSDVLEQVLGVGLTVFTLSERAADVVRGEGIERAHNVPRFLAFKERQAEGQTEPIEEAEFALPEGGVIAVDEATMLDTPRMARLVEEAEAAGVQKIIVVGDTAQTDAVDAGGAFAMLVGEIDRRQAQAEAAERAERRALMPGTGGMSAAEQVAAWTGDRERAAEPVATAGKVHRLTEVRRFVNAWEKKASADIRVGKVEALAEYETRGRIKGYFDEAEAFDAAAKDFRDDHLSGKQAIMVTATGEEASRAAGIARRLLAEAGHVEADGVELRDQNVAGVGDIVQTRENNRSLGVNNRDVWQVVGRTDTGALEVRALEGKDEAGQPAWGQPLALPASYVRTQVELAYAATTEGFQGATVDSGIPIVTPAMDASQYYPANTRGRERNTSHVVLSPTPEIGRARAQVSALEHKLAHTDLTVEQRASADIALVGARRELEVAESRGETAVGRLAQILSKDDHVQAARVEMELEKARERSLAHLGPQWESGVQETRAATHRDVLARGLGDDAERVLADPISHRLYTLLREAELRGHEPAKVLDRVMHHRDGRWHDLGQVDSPASALYARIKLDMKAAEPTRPVPMTFESRVPAPELGDTENERLSFWRAIGRGMDDRTAAAARELADAPEPWAIRALGPVPEEPVARGGWIGRAAHAVGYRERYGLTDQRNALGARPTQLSPEQAWHWDLAARGIGMPDHQRDLEAQPEGVLHNRVQDWQRAQSFAPQYVGDDLALEHGALRDAEAAIVAARTAGLDTVEHEAARELHAGRVAKLERVAELRAGWVEKTADMALLAEDAQRELDRRGELDRAVDGVPLPPEPDWDPEFDDEPLDDPWADVAPEPAPEVFDDAAWADARASAFAEWDRVRQVEAPRFGSPAFHALADDDPIKDAAVDIAAGRAWNYGQGLQRDRVYAELDRQAAWDEQARWGSAERVFAREAELPKAADGDGTFGPERTGDLNSPGDLAEIAAEHAGDEFAEVVDDEPVDVLPTLEWAQGRLDPGAPAYGSPAWDRLAADDPQRDAARVAAAMEVWNLGDDLGELQERTLGPVPVAEDPVDDEPFDDEPFDEELVDDEPIEEPALAEDTKSWLLEAAHQHAAEVADEPEPEPEPVPEPQVADEPEPALNLEPEPEVVDEPVAEPEAEPEVEDVDAKYGRWLDEAEQAREVFDVPAAHEPDPEPAPEPVEYPEPEPDLEPVDDY